MFRTTAGFADSKAEKPPVKMSEFRKLDPNVRFFDIPELPERRKCTNIVFLIVHIVFSLFVLILVGVGISEGDLRRVTHGYDYCANYCGVKNTKIENIRCSGKDMSEKGYVMIPKQAERDRDENDFTSTIDSLTTDSSFNEDYTWDGPLLDAEDDDEAEDTEDTTTTGDSFDRTTPDPVYRYQCVEKCDPPNEILFFNRCVHPEAVGDHFWTQLGGDIIDNIPIMFGMFVLSFGICILCLFGLRYKTKATAITCIVLQMVGALALIIYFGVVRMYPHMAFGAVMLIITIVTLACLWRHFPLVVVIIQETLIIMFRSPWLFAQPLLVAAIKILFFIGSIFLIIHYCTIAKLVKSHLPTHVVHYEYFGWGAVAIISFLLFFLVFQVWFCVFLDGCLVMIFAYTVEAQYWSKRNERPIKPIRTAYRVLCRYHLGTVSCGSMIITIVVVLRAIVEWALSDDGDANYCSLCMKMILRCCMAALEEFVRYLTEKAYIMTAMHGKGFWSSGMRAFRLLWYNFLDTFSLLQYINTIYGGAFCLSVVVPLLCTFILLVVLEKDIYSTIATMCILMFFIFLASACILGCSSTCMDVLFLCYCEDKLLNDGTDKYPYYMPANMAVVMEDGLALDHDKREEREQRRRDRANSRA